MPSHPTDSEEDDEGVYFDWTYGDEMTPRRALIKTVCKLTDVDPENPPDEIKRILGQWINLDAFDPLLFEGHEAARVEFSVGAYRFEMIESTRIRVYK